MQQEYNEIRKKVSGVVDPVTSSLPSDWSHEKQIIAKDAMAVLQREYPKWLWQIEFQDEPASGAIAALIIRLGDVQTAVVYVINYRDIDRDNMRCVRTAGGMLLEAHGLSRTRGRHDEVHGLKKTPSGLIVPDYAAIPENNPGYDRIKERGENHAKATAHEIREGYLRKFEPQKLAEEYEEKHGLVGLSKSLDG